MSGVFQTLFGGGTQESQQTTTPVDVTPEEFKALRDPASEILRLLLGTPGTGAITGQGGGAFGQFAAPITGLEQTLVGQAGAQAQATFPGAQDLLQRTISGEFLSPESNPFLQATIEAAQRPLLEGFRDVTLPRLLSQFTGAGQQVQPGGSSAFDRATAIASRGLAGALGDVSTQIAGQNFQAERARQQEATQLAPAITAQELENTVTGLRATALPRLIEQFGIDQGVIEFNNRINVVLQAIGLITGTTVIGNVGQQTSSGSQQGGILPALAAFAPRGQ